MSAFRSSPVRSNVFGNRYKLFCCCSTATCKSLTEKEVCEIYFLKLKTKRDRNGNTDILHSVSVTWENYCFIFCISINDSWILFWFNDTHKKYIGISYVYVLLLMCVVDSLKMHKKTLYGHICSTSDLPNTACILNKYIFEFGSVSLQLFGVCSSTKVQHISV